MVVSLYLVMVLVVVAAVAAGVIVMARTRRSPAAPPRPRDVQDPPSRPAREVLDERLASGDISQAEYEQRRRRLDTEGRF